MWASGDVSEHCPENPDNGNMRAADTHQSRAPGAPISSTSHRQESERHSNRRIASYKPATNSLGAVASQPTTLRFDDDPSFQPLPDKEHDEQLFRGSPSRSLPCGHSEAIPRNSVHAGNHRCVVHHADWFVYEPASSEQPDCNPDVMHHDTSPKPCTKRL
jgi:hypothetical protein